MEEKAVLFTNYTDRDFAHTWGKVKYDFPAKQSMMLIEGLANHFAKHLAVRELNEVNKNTGGGALQVEMKKALSSTNVKSQDKTKLQQEVMNANVDAKEEKAKLVAEAEERGMSVDKRKGSETIRKELEAFEGLNKE